MRDACKCAAVAVLALALGACASVRGDRAPTVEVAANAVWAVERVEGADPVAARRVERLIEQALRARGVRDVRPAADVRDARYRIGGTVHEWPVSALPGEVDAVDIGVWVHSVIDGTLLLDERRRQRPSQGVTGRRAASAAALTTIERALDPLRIVDAVADPALAVDAVTAGSSRTGGAPDGLTRVATGLAVESMTSESLDAAAADALAGRATAFWYDDAPPLDLLGQFDRVVLEADNIDADELDALGQDEVATFAYLSIGEVGPERPWARGLAADWTLGRNEAWDSAVMDLAHPGWSDFVLRRVDALMARGYDGLFLDTMDSFTLHARTPADRARQADGLAELIARIGARHPGIRLIANRGFEVLDRVAPQLEAIAAESLYANWNNATQRYGAVPAQDRAWLLGQLERAHDVHGLDVIAIDYVPPAERERARAVATRIAAHGFVPWVATPMLDHMGVGALDVVPRRVLLPYDSRVNGAQENAEVHRMLATPLEYLGYVPVYHDLATAGLPPDRLGGRYAGVAFWSRGPQIDGELQAWFNRQIEDGVRVALLGTPTLVPGSALADRIGLGMRPPIDADTAVVSRQDGMIGFEKPLARRFEPLGAQPRSTGTDNRVHLTVTDANDASADLVVTGPWGGVASNPAVLEIDQDSVAYWILDPYTFLQTALGLDALPMPDVTSEGGKRLWFAHIDGDAMPSWAELPGRQLGAEVIRDRILDRWPLPHTVSVVEAELTSVPAWRDRAVRMHALARELFARPEVEIATHTYSHPFAWQKIAAAPASGEHNLAIPGYRYSPEREIGGSAAWIDRVLAPEDKRTTVMLWSGDALPDAAALQAADDAGLANMNGGFTTITDAEPALTLVTPMVRTVGERVQVYAPIMNENVYTNDWRGPYDGFRRVIETFRLTDRPRRLKPINVYYHFYAGTKPASIRSLEEVYAWSTEQDIAPVSVSDYLSRVDAFRAAGLARRLDGRYRLDRLGSLRSVRIAGGTARVDRAASDGVIAQRKLHDGVYLTVDPARPVIISLDPVLAAARAESGR